MTTEQIAALEYIVSLQDTQPELSALLMKCAVEAAEIEADQRVILAETKEQ